MQCKKKNVFNWFSYRRKKLLKQAKTPNKPKEKIAEPQVKLENIANQANQVIKQEVLETPAREHQTNFSQSPSISSMSSIPTNGIGFSDNILLLHLRNIWMANQMQNYYKSLQNLFFFNNLQKYYL